MTSAESAEQENILSSLAGLRRELEQSHKTLRDEFAMVIVGGLSQTPAHIVSEPDEWDWNKIARTAYKAADAMLKAREANQ